MSINQTQTYHKYYIMNFKIAHRFVYILVASKFAVLKLQNFKVLYQITIT